MTVSSSLKSSIWFLVYSGPLEPNLFLIVDLGLGTLIVNVLILRSSMMQLNNQGNKPGDQANPTLIHPEGSALETGLVRTSSYAPAPSRQPEAGPSTPFNGSHQLSTGSSSHRPSSSSRRSSSLPRPSRTTEPKPLTGTPVFQPPQAGPSTTSSSHSRRKPSQIAKRAAPAPQPQQAGPSTASSSSHSRRKPNQTAKRATPASTTSNPSTSLATIPATAQAGPALGLPSGSGMVSSDHTSPPANVASNPSASFATPATVLTTATATAPATATGQGTNNPAQSEPGIALAPTSASASSGAATLQPVSDTPNHSETPAIAHSTSRGNQNLHPLASRIPGDIRHRYKSKSPNQSGPEA